MIGVGAGISGIIISSIVLSRSRRGAVGQQNNNKEYRTTITEKKINIAVCTISILFSVIIMQYYLSPLYPTTALRRGHIWYKRNLSN